VSLASVADYETVTGVTVGEDSGRIERLLDLASAAVLAEAHGQLIVATEDTEEIVYPYEGVGRLSQRPVTAVGSVVVDGETLDTDEYRWTPGGNRRPAYLIRRSNGYDCSWSCREMTVTYSHGWDPVPAQIIVAVVNMVKGVIDLGGGGEVASKSNGPFSVTFVEGSQVNDLRVAGPVKSTLDRLCGVPGPASVPVLGTIETGRRPLNPDRFDWYR
jgi:hypothetical protein